MNVEAELLRANAKIAILELAVTALLNHLPDRAEAIASLHRVLAASDDSMQAHAITDEQLAAMQAETARWMQALARLSEI